MEIVVPLPVTLNFTYSSAAYTHDAWLAGTSYSAGAVRRHEVSSYNVRDYLCKVAHSSTTSNAPGTNLSTPSSLRGWAYVRAKLAGKSTLTSTSSGGHWTDLGPASFTSASATYRTNVRLTDYPEWTTGSIGLNEARYDPADNMDYLANVAISSGDNTLRPSQCIMSPDETIAARWSVLGAANAFACLDHQIDTTTKNYGPTGASLPNIWTEILLNPKEFSLATNPTDFITGWIAQNGPVVADQYMNPLDSSTQDADKFTLLLAPPTPGYLWRDYTVPAGTTFTASVYASSPDPSHPAQLMRIMLMDSAWGFIAHTYINLTSSFTYASVTGNVPSSSGDTSVVRVVLEVLTASLYGIVAFWGFSADYNVPVIDRLCFSGLENVASIQYRVKRRFARSSAASVLGTLVTVPTIPSGSVSHDTTVRAVSIPIDPLLAETGTVIYLQFNPLYVDKPIKVGSIVAGQALQLGYSDYGVETGLISFSKKERDANFGTVKFLKRGKARQVRANLFIDPDYVTGDVIYQLLAKYDGQPLWFDFNNYLHGVRTEYERLRVFGFWTSVTQNIQAVTRETLQCTIEGLVE